LNAAAGRQAMKPHEFLRGMTVLPARGRLVRHASLQLTIEYDGSPFVGWQSRTNGPSVQGVLAAAFELLR